MSREVAVLKSYAKKFKQKIDFKLCLKYEIDNEDDDEDLEKRKQMLLLKRLKITRRRSSSHR